MNLRTKLLAAFLAVSMLLSLTACSDWRQDGHTQQQSEIQQSEPQQTQAAADDPVPTLAGGGYFSGVNRPDVPFSDMQAKAWTEDEFDALAEAMTEAAASGSAAAFHRALHDAQQALYDLDTARTLVSLENLAHADDEEISRRYNEVYLRCLSAVDRFYATLHTLAQQESCRPLLDLEFSTADIEYFAAYDPDAAGQSLTLSAQEQDLILQYEQEISSSSPDPDVLGEIYISLVGVRKEIAAAAGYAQYADYIYENDYARAYTPEQAQTVWKIAKESYAPLLQEYAQSVADAEQVLEQSQTLDVSEAAILTALQTGAEQLSPEIAASCRYLLQNKLYDIAPSEEKLDTGCTVWLTNYQAPFIFNTPGGWYYDITSMIHEFGHFTSAYYNGTDNLYGVCDYDLSELQSQGMEVMYLPLYDMLFGEQDAPLLRAQTIYNLLSSVVQGAMYDEFQQRVYAQENLTPELVNELFQQIRASYGYESCDGEEYEWMSVVHNFEQPFYYISYAVSSLPALELFARQQQSKADALDTYLRAAAMSDEEYYLRDAIAATGLTNQMIDGVPDTLIAAIRASGVLDAGTNEP